MNQTHPDGENRADARAALAGVDRMRSCVRVLVAFSGDGGADGVGRDGGDGDDDDNAPLDSDELAACLGSYALRPRTGTGSWASSTSGKEGVRPQLEPVPGGEFEHNPNSYTDEFE